MKVLSIDQASSSGFCLAEDGKILEYGVFKSKGEDYAHKIASIRDWLGLIIVKHNPDLVTVEDTQARNNASVHAKLSGLLYVLRTECIRMEVEHRVLHPSTWRSKLGLTSRPSKEAKKASMAYASEVTGDDITSDDIADAICMAIAVHKEGLE